MLRIISKGVLIKKRFYKYTEYGKYQPAEVSKILRQQLEGIQTGVELEEVGTVLEVGDGIARIYGFQMQNQMSL